MKKIYFFIAFLIATRGFAQVEPIGTARLKSNGTVVTVAGIVTNGADFDNRNRTRSFQDATGGIGLFAQATAAAPTLQALAEGDSIVVTGTLGEFRSLKQLGEPLTITVVSSGNPLPTPVSVSITDLQNPAVAEPLESMLVKVEDVVFDTGDILFGSGSSGRSYDIDDPTNLVSGNCFPVSTDCNVGPVMRVSPGNSLLGVEVPKGLVTVIGNLGQFDAAYQVVVRGNKDVEVGLSVENVDQKDIQTTSFSITFQTNQSAKAKARFGTIFLVDVNTTDPANYIADYDTTFFGEVTTEVYQKEHTLNLTGLTAATPYFVEVVCQTEAGKQVSFTDVFSTASESTGEIKVFFNKTVDPTVSRNGASPIVTNDIAQVMAEYIDRANTSVDVAIYNANSAGVAKIATALQNAKSRGVEVRYIFSGEGANNTGSLLNGIPRMRDRNSTGDAALTRTGTGNHNKFIVIDPEDRLNSYVFTGSGNFTDNNLFTDPNNFLVIQDQALARAYRLEFDEMWGEGPVNPNSTQTSSSNADFNRQKLSRFGGQKIKNTPSKFMIGDREVELFFTPTDGATKAIRNAIYEGDSDVRFALLLITSDELRTALDSMQNVGLDMKGLIDDENAVPDAMVSGSDYVWLRDKGVNVNSYMSTTSQLHHKYAVIDAVRTDSDPTVTTGSFNWTSAAETSNDENAIIIHDANIANMYRQEFAQRWFEATGLSDAYLLATNEDKEGFAKIYPNPSKGNFTVTFNQIVNKVSVKITDMQGRILETKEQQLNEKKLAINTELAVGMYVLHLEVDGKTFAQKIIVAK